jgi:DNA modification methylase
VSDTFSSLLICGDAAKTLASLDDNSVDSIVTDPPYGLSKQPDAAEVLRHWLAGDDYEHGGSGFMGKSWDSFVPGPALWKECLRVLKPGGHLLSFGGTRTYDLMCLAIRIAGFEIRDSVHWHFGSGFPKSLDVSKAIDKAAGAEREVVGMRSTHHERPITDKWDRSLNRSEPGNPFGDNPLVVDITAPATDAAKQWEGWGTALKPAHEPIVVARKPLVGTVAGNVLAYGTGALNIDGTRVAMGDEYDPTKIQRQKSKGDGAIDGAFGAGALVGTEIPTYKPGGRWPANLVFTHAADCVQVGATDDTFGGGANATSGFVDGYESGDGFTGKTVKVPVWRCADGCPVAELDGQSGKIPASARATRVVPKGHAFAGEVHQGVDKFGGPPAGPTGFTDSGGASRFFTVTEWDPTADVAPFRYVAKPSKRERNAGLDGLPGKREADRAKADGVGGDNPRNRSNAAKVNHHPTVKPVALMRWLVRLVTPPGGVVLDPFIGSGTTGIAAHKEGMCFIGIDQSDEYLTIAYHRVVHAGAGTPVCFGFDEPVKDEPVFD